MCLSISDNIEVDMRFCFIQLSDFFDMVIHHLVENVPNTSALQFGIFLSQYDGFISGHEVSI